MIGLRRVFTQFLAAVLFALLLPSTLFAQDAGSSIPFSLSRNWIWEQSDGLRGSIGMKWAPQLKIRGIFPLSRSVSLRWNCGLSLSKDMFQEDQVRLKRPTLLASVAFDFEFSRTLHASVGYAHRTRIAGGDHGMSGPSATATFTVQLF
jgi:hypothetical protein